jgi:dTDP-4-dehydrorhamnose 3,5-epimerase
MDLTDKPSKTVARAQADLVSGTVPASVRVGELTTHTDQRGSLTEIYRLAWPGAPELPQWNHVRNAPNSMRGMHVHMEHSDFIVVIQGEMLLALRDARKEGDGAGGILRLKGERMNWVFIPPGVAHAFYSPRGNTLVYGQTHFWHAGDELCCRWDDPDMGLQWPAIKDPVISPRDAAAGTFKDLVEAWELARTPAR